jgi:hypothetical protein
MSHEIGAAGEVTVSAFCGPVGRRESFQLERDGAYICVTFEELKNVLKMVRDHRAAKEHFYG